MSYLLSYYNWRTSYNRWGTLSESANGQLTQSELRQVSTGPGEGVHKLNPIAAEAYDKMKAAAAQDGIDLKISDSYRDLESQIKVAKKKGLYSQGGLAAKPGTSNHGLGAAVDLQIKKNSAEYRWLKKNAASFGFTNIPREPWHWEHKESAEAVKNDQVSEPTQNSVLDQKTPPNMNDIQNGKLLLKKGMTTSEVKEIQTRLKEKGFFFKEPDGVFDQDTEDSVKYFQSLYGIKSDGIVGKQTYGMLFGLTPPNQVTTTSAAAPTTQPGATSVNPTELYNYLKTKMDDNHALGILSNIKRESNFNSGSVGDHGTSGGLFQHHATRFANMKKAAGGESTWKTNWKAQVDFALSEKDGQTYLNTKFNNPLEASEWWVRNFERPANVENEVTLRKEYVASIKNTLQANGINLA